MEFFIAEVFTPAFDFIGNGVEWLLTLLFGTSTGAETSLAQGPRTYVTTEDQEKAYKQKALAALNFDYKRRTAGGEAKDTYYFPVEDAVENAERPQIRFSCIKMKYEPKNTKLTRSSAYFPCPGNIAFGDAANLGSIDLGIMGAAMDMTQQFGKASDKANAHFEAAGNALMKTIGSAVDGVTQGLVTKGYFANKQAVNNFTNTTYQGNNVRNFTFNFKLVADSAIESQMVRDIDHFFRSNMYGGAQEENKDNFNAFLSYPPIWEIDFLESMKREGAVFNQYLPKLFACYLGSYNATFNTTAAAWHPGGAPLEVDMSLTFTESRALNAIDIEALNGLSGNYYDEEISNMAARGIGAKGRATAAPDKSLDNFIVEASKAEFDKTGGKFEEKK